jgi:branched-subunit amino acid transport protein
MSQNAYLISVILAMMAVTFLIRVLPLHINAEKLPKAVEPIIEFIPSAIVSSITIPGLFFLKSGDFSLYNADILSAFAVILIALYSKNLILSVITGVIAHVVITNLFFNSL